MAKSDPPAVPLQATRRPARAAAGVIALAAWAGLAAGCVAVYGRTGSVGETLWVMAAYFTNTTGLLVALLFTGLMLGTRKAAHPSFLAAASLMVLLVGIVQRVLLHGLKVLQGADAVADAALHILLPVLVPLFWLAFAEKGRLRPRDPWLWALYPLGYLVWALVRGALRGRAIYPFLDPSPAGWMPVAVAVAVITAGFLLFGTLFVLADRRLARVANGAGKTGVTDR